MHDWFTEWPKKGGEETAGGDSLVGGQAGRPLGPDRKGPVGQGEDLVLRRKTGAMQGSEQRRDVM